MADPVPDDHEAAVTLAPMRRRDLRAVLRIEAQVYPRPWTFTLYLAELNMRASRHYVVARIGGHLVGYGGLLFTADEAHVTTLAVDPVWHRHGLGTRLLLHLARVARARSAKHLTLEVRASNLPAQQLYRRFGFEAAGIRKNYYSEVNEDAIVMWAHDVDTDEYAARLEELEAALPAPSVEEG